MELLSIKISRNHFRLDFLVVMGHSTKHGCAKCTQVGHKPSNSAVTFRTTKLAKRELIQLLKIV